MLVFLPSPANLKSRNLSRLDRPARSVRLRAFSYVICEDCRRVAGCCSTMTTSAPGRASSRPTFTGFAPRVPAELPFLYCRWYRQNTLSSRAFRTPSSFSLSSIFPPSKCSLYRYLCNFVFILSLLLSLFSICALHPCRMSENSLSLSLSLSLFLRLCYLFFPSSFIFLSLFYLCYSEHSPNTRLRIIMPAVDMYATVKVVRFPRPRLSLPIYIYNDTSGGIVEQQPPIRAIHPCGILL